MWKSMAGKERSFNESRKTDKEAQDTVTKTNTGAKHLCCPPNECVLSCVKIFKITSTKFRVETHEGTCISKRLSSIIRAVGENNI